MIPVEVRGEGIVFAVKAQPGARKRALLGIHGDALKLAVQAAPEKGKANQALLELLSEVFDCHRHQLALLQGAASNRKRFLLIGVTVEEFQRQLKSQLEKLP